MPDSPAGMAIWGNWLYVTHYWSGELSLIDRSTNQRITTIATGDDIAHFASIAIDRRYGLAYLPQTIPNVDLVDAALEGCVGADASSGTGLDDGEVEPVSVSFACTDSLRLLRSGSGLSEAPGEKG